MNRATIKQSALRRVGPPALLSLATILAVVASAPDADAKRARPAATTEAIAPREAGEPVMAIVSIKGQRVTLYDAEGWIYRAPVSTGTSGRETPAGVFAVVEKDKDHRSTMYDDAWMPHMLRITWNGVALHGGPLPGYPASHGCVRMPYSFAERIFDRAKIGLRVIVSPEDAAPVDISHPVLFSPSAEALSAAPARAETLTREAAAAAQAAEDAKTAAAAAVRALKPLKPSLRKLEREKARAEAALKAADKVLIAAATDEARAKAEERQQNAAQRLGEAATELETAKADADAKQATAAATKEAAKAAAANKAETEKLATGARLALEPASIYISRATQKLYVRRNTRKPLPDGGELFDSSIEVPVTIRDPDRPIGTHIFTAMAKDEAGLRWSAVTIEAADSAKSALDRITIPQEVLDQIAPTALPRSSIVISDEPLSAETNYRTEFVAVLSDQPQGGFITRKPTREEPIASDDGWGDGGWDSSGWDNGWSNGFSRRTEPRPAPRRRGGDYYYQPQSSWW